MPKTMYEVSAILDRRTVKGHTQYLVEWQNYKREDATWEPATSLHSVQDMLDMFNAKKKTKLLRKRMKITQNSKKRYPNPTKPAIPVKGLIITKKQRKTTARKAKKQFTISDSKQPKQKQVQQSDKPEQINNKPQVSNDKSQQIIEVLRWVVSAKSNTCEFQVRVNSQIVRMSVNEVRNNHCQQLCKFYQKLFRFCQ